MAKVIAKTCIGAEFNYSASNAFRAPERSARRICEVLNASGWRLNAGEKWHIYDWDWYKEQYTAAGYQKFEIRNGNVIARRY